MHFVIPDTLCDIHLSLPSVVAISLVEVEIWYILIFDVRRRIHIIILLQSVAMQFCRLLWHISHYKVRQSNFITKCDRLLLQSASGITKCDRLYYNMRQVLQSVTVITRWDVTILSISTSTPSPFSALSHLSSKMFDTFWGFQLWLISYSYTFISKY